MTIKKQNLIAISKKLRNKKDRLKSWIKTGKPLSLPSENQLVFPRQLFDTSLDLQSDKWYFNGFVIKSKDQLLVVDPGVDFYSRFTTAGLSPLDIGGLILSHGHTDHSGDIVIFIEKVLRNKSQKIDVFIPKSAFEAEIPIYHQVKLQKSEHVNLVLLNKQKNNHSHTILGNLRIEFIPLYQSSPDTFGFKLYLQNQTVGYVSDTGYAVKVKTDQGVYPPSTMEGNFIKIQEKHEYIKNFYQDVGQAIVNINDLHYNRHSKYHLSGWCVLDLFRNSSLQQLILQHLSPINADGEDSNYIYKLFFSDQPYETLLPHYLGRVISL